MVPLAIFKQVSNPFNPIEIPSAVIESEEPIAHPNGQDPKRDGIAVKIEDISLHEVDCENASRSSYTVNEKMVPQSLSRKNVGDIQIEQVDPSEVSPALLVKENEVSPALEKEN